VLRIYDAQGREVGSRPLGTVRGGRHTIGLGAAAEGLPAGVYTYAVEVTTPGGATVGVRTYTTGKVDGVKTGASGIVVTAGALEIAFSTIVQVQK
jgi:flagellar hook assembly protein FlgD